VLALAEAALHAQRPSCLVDDDDRVRTVGLAGAAQIFDLVTGTKHAIIDHWAFRFERCAVSIVH
jgi:hypothetical protein